jgi:hypothetical protein
MRENGRMGRNREREPLSLLMGESTVGTGRWEKKVEKGF